MTLQMFALSTAAAALAMQATAQQTVCGQTEYAAMLRKSPPTAEWMHYPIPPGARINIQITLAQGWPQRSFAQTIVYDFAPGANVADVERFFVDAGVYRAAPHGTTYIDVNPNRKPGDVMRKVTEEDGLVTFTLSRNTRPSGGTPFGDVAWTAKQLRDHPPTAVELVFPIYPGAVLDIDSSTALIIADPDPYLYYSTPDRPETVRAFYGMSSSQIKRELSRDDTVTVEESRARAMRGGSRIILRLSYLHTAAPGRVAQPPATYLTDRGLAVLGAPPGWKPRQWKGGCDREPIAPIVGAQP